MFNGILQEFEVPDNYKALFDIETQNWTIYWKFLENILSIRVQFNEMNDICELQVFLKKKL
jgi:hypothetical protein